MSIFGSIMSKIFGHSQAAQPGATPAGEAAAQGGSPPPPGAHDDAASAGQPASLQNVDVTAILDGLAAKSPQKLDWQHSIVDLMKLLGLDSSLEARKGLAQELHYDGSTGLGGDEHLAAPPGHAEAGAEWRQGAGRAAALIPPSWRAPDGRAASQATAPCAGRRRVATWPSPCSRRTKSGRPSPRCISAG